jgi:hypothetical protein
MVILVCRHDLYINVVRSLQHRLKWIMRLLITSAILTIYSIAATGQIFSTKKALTFYPATYIDTEYRYTDSTGISVIIQNSIRKGGRYTDPAGKVFFSVIYWYRVINETSTPLELTISFPADSFATSQDGYFKAFLPLDTMTFKKEGLYAYGATGLKAFLDTGLNQPTMLQRTINHDNACLFYIGALYYQAYAPARAELILKDRDFYYRIGGIEIPCGHLAVKN